MTSLGEIKLRKFDKDKHTLNAQIKITTEFKFRLWLAKLFFVLGAKVLGMGIKINAIHPGLYKSEEYPDWKKENKND
jgi:hypothetical protein